MYTKTIFIAFCLFLAACDQQHTTNDTKSVIAKDQIEALEKAKKVEQILLDSAKKNDEVTY